MTDIPVITIDGPSGSGKGTVSQQLATSLGWHYLDSGAIYRALAYAAELAGLELSKDKEKIVSLAQELKIAFKPAADGGADVLLAGTDISSSIRKIGRASCRERVEISVVAVSLKKEEKNNVT